jgi:hypothetical protein
MIIPNEGLVPVEGRLSCGNGGGSVACRHSRDRFFRPTAALSWWLREDRIKF